MREKREDLGLCQGQLRLNPGMILRHTVPLDVRQHCLTNRTGIAVFPPIVVMQTADGTTFIEPLHRLIPVTSAFLHSYSDFLEAIACGDPSVSVHIETSFEFLIFIRRPVMFATLLTKMPFGEFFRSKKPKKKRTCRFCDFILFLSHGRRRSPPIGQTAASRQGASSFGLLQNEQELPPFHSMCARVKEMACDEPPRTAPNCHFDQTSTILLRY